MSETASLLPPNATDLEVAAARVAGNVTLIPTPIREVKNAYTCPEALLPYLAYEVAVDEWDEEWPTQTKRDVIAQSIEVKRVKGTYGAVQRAVSALGLPARVQEWYQQMPAAGAYTFRLHIEADQVGFTQRQLIRIPRVVEQAKNLRSHMSGVNLSMRTTSGLRKASAPLTGHENTVDDGTPRYADGVSGLDLLVDAAVNGDASTAAAVDELEGLVDFFAANIYVPRQP